MYQPNHLAECDNKNSIVNKNKPVNTLTAHDLSIIAVFGALWGLMEITLGATLKGLKIPMGGALLTVVAAVIFMTGRYFVRRRGSILLMGAVAAILKIFSVGTVTAGPFLAIWLEAIFAEVLITSFGINRFSYFITPVFLLLYTIVHPFITQGLLFGDDIFTIYLLTFQKLAEVFRIRPEKMVWIAMSYAGIHVLLGLFSGWMAYSLAIKVEQEVIRSTKKV